MSKFTDKDIGKLVDENIKGKNLNELEDELHNLCGGIAIAKDDKIVLAPNCCVTFQIFTIGKKLKTTIQRNGQNYG